MGLVLHNFLEPIHGKLNGTLAVGGLSQPMVRPLDHMDLLGCAKVVEDLPSLVHGNKLILLSMNDHAVCNPGQEGKESMLRKILKESLFRKGMTFGPLIRLEVVQVKGSRRSPPL